MKRLHHSVLLTLLVLVLGCVKEDSSLWVDLGTIRNADSISLNILNLHRATSGALIAIGYFDNEDVDCGTDGLLPAFRCKPFRVYRSLDSGLSWEEVSTPAMSEQNALIKGDKLDNVPDFFFARWAKTAKNLASPLLYSDGAKFTQITSGGGSIQMFIGGNLYRSLDNGASWTLTQPAPEDASHRPSNSDVAQSKQHLTPIYQNEQYWYAPSGSSLNNSYYLRYDSVLRSGTSTPEDTLRFSEVYKVADGTMFGTAYHTSPMKHNPFLWKSNGDEAHFSRVDLFEDPDFDISETSILACMGDKLILRIKRRQLADSLLEHNRVIYYILGTTHGTLSRFVFPTQYKLDADATFKMTFDHDGDTIFLSHLDMIYMSKSRYLGEVLESPDYRVNSVSLTSNPPSVSDYDLLDLLMQGKNCEDERCLNEVFPEDDFSWDARKQNGDIAIKPNGNVWLSGVEGRSFRFDVSLLEGYTKIRLSTTSHESFDKFLLYLQGREYSIIKTYPHENKRSSWPFKNNGKRFWLKGTLDGEVLFITLRPDDFTVDVSSRVQFQDNERLFRHAIDQGRTRTVAKSKIHLDLELGMPANDYQEHMASLLDKGAISLCGQTYCRKEQFRVEETEVASGFEAEFLEGHLSRFGFRYTLIADDRTQRSKAAALYSAVVDDLFKSIAIEDFHVFSSETITHVINGSLYVKIYESNDTGLEFIDLRVFDSTLDYR